MVETSALSAKILAVNAPKHQLTLTDPDGKKRTIKVSSKVTNLNQLKVGRQCGCARHRVSKSSKS